MQDVNTEPIVGGVRTAFSGVMPTVLSVILQMGTDVFGLVNSVFLMISAVVSLLIFKDPDAIKQTQETV